MTDTGGAGFSLVSFHDENSIAIASSLTKDHVHK